MRASAGVGEEFEEPYFRSLKPLADKASEGDGRVGVMKLVERASNARSKMSWREGMECWIGLG